ncbi:LacI family transcriptional regulator [Candidatus Acetothermia bacterium]|nr:MAG: LacI family transcriptional regulator [Candidatus Acetothermia bacterium]
MRNRLNNSGRTVTIRDIAEALNLSPSTVSRALNNKGRVSQRTKARVQRMAEKLGYRPSMAGRGLATQSTANLGFLVSERQLLSAGSFYGEIMGGAEETAAESGYRLVFATNATVNAPLLVAEGRVDGLILAGCELPPELIYRARELVPVVVVDNSLPGIDSVAIDNVRGAEQAVAHLIAQGHRRIAFVTETLDNLSFSERFQGYRRALTAHGLPVDEELVAEGVPGSECGYVAFRKLLHLERLPNAVFAANDEAAAGAIRAIKEAGLKVPDDIAVVGFDDGALAPHTDPPLTSVRVFRHHMGRWAVLRLLELLKEPDSPPIEIRVSTSLVVRGSCGALRRKGGDRGKGRAVGV